MNGCISTVSPSTNLMGKIHKQIYEMLEKVAISDKLTIEALHSIMDIYKNVIY